MNIFRTAESFDVVRYTPDGEKVTAHHVALNIPTVFFDVKDGFKPMPIFEYLRYLWAKNSDHFNDFAQLLKRKDDSLVVALNNVDLDKANAFIAFLNDLNVSAQKSNLYLASQLPGKALLESFEQWLRDSGEYKQLHLNHQLNNFADAEKGLELVQQHEKQKPVLLSRLIMQFKGQAIGSNDIVQYI